MSIEALSEHTKIAVFKGKKIRKTLLKNEWWFSVVDIISVLTDSSNARRYWSDLKIKLSEEGFNELYEMATSRVTESWFWIKCRVR